MDLFVDCKYWLYKNRDTNSEEGWLLLHTQTSTQKSAGPLRADFDTLRGIVTHRIDARFEVAQ